MKQNVYQVSEFWGRGYSVEGLFLATPEEVAAAVGKTAHLGEICGKHSEVSLDIKADTIKLVTEIQSEIDLLVRLDLLHGSNPIAAIAEREGAEALEDEDGKDTGPLFAADPNCDHEIVPSLGGGVCCTKCPGWFCY